LLNFVLGNLIGISEIDVQSVELLPGHLLLYGANALWYFVYEQQKPIHKSGITAGKIGQQVKSGGIKRLC
jgi:hypothetical protein